MYAYNAQNDAMAITDIRTADGKKVARCSCFDDRAIKSAQQKAKSPVFYHLVGEGAYVYDGTGHYAVDAGMTPSEWVSAYC